MEEKKEGIALPDYTALRMILNQTLARNTGKATFSVVAYTLLESVLYSVAMAPFAGGYLSEQITPYSLIFMLFVAFLACIAVHIIGYGLSVIMGRMVLKEYVTIGFLFVAFKKPDKRVIFSSILYTVLTALVLLFAFLLLLHFKDKIPPFTEENAESFIGFAAQVSLAVMAAFFVLTFPLVFLAFVIYQNPSMPFFLALKRSLSIFFYKPHHFITFLIRACGRNILLFFLASAMQFFFATSLPVFSFILTFVQFVQQYKILVRYRLSLPVYFFSVTGSIKMYGSDFTSHSEDSE